MESSVQGTQRDSSVMQTFPVYSSLTDANPEQFYKGTDAAKQLTYQVGVDAPTKKFTEEKERKRLEAIKRNRKNARCWPCFVKYVQQKIPSKVEETEVAAKS